MTSRILVACLLLGSASASRAADFPLTAIPETAGVVVRLKSPEATVKRVADLAAQLKPEYRAPVEGIAQSLGQTLENPMREGVNSNADWWWVIFPVPNQPPVTVHIVPATDAAKMKQALGDRFTTFAHDGWLVYSTDSDSISQFETRKSGGIESIDKLVDARARELFARNDLSVFVNVRALRETYRDEINSLKRQGEQALEQVRNATQAQTQGVNPAAMAAMYGELLKAFFQMIDDLQSFTGGVLVGERSIDADACFAVAAKSPSDAWLARQTRSEMKLLGRMPPKKLAYMALAGDLAAFTQWGVTFSNQVLEGNEKFKQAMDEAVKLIESAGITGMNWMFDLGRAADGVLQMAAITESKNAGQMLSATLKLSEAMTEVSAGGIKQTATVKRGARAVSGQAIDRITIKYEVDQKADPLGITALITKTFYGPEGMRTELAAVGNALLQTVGSDEKQMEELIAAAKSADGKPEAAWTASRGKLPAEANAIALFDLARIAANALRIVGELKAIPLPIDAERMAALAKELPASYCAVSAVAEAQGARFKLHVPIEQGKGIVKLIDAAMPRQPPQP